MTKYWTLYWAINHHGVTRTCSIQTVVSRCARIIRRHGIIVVGEVWAVVALGAVAGGCVQTLGGAVHARLARVAVIRRRAALSVTVAAARTRRGVHSACAEHRDVITRSYTTCHACDFRYGIPLHVRKLI